MVKPLQFGLYAVGILPAITTGLTIWLSHDILLTVGVDILLAVIVSAVMRNLIPKDDQKQYQSLEDYPTITRSTGKFNTVAFVAIAFILILSYVLFWIVGLAQVLILMSMTPIFSSNGWRLFYLIFTLFLIGITVPVIESAYYYSMILKNLEGNAIQGIIVGILSSLKGCIIICVALAFDTIPCVELCGVWVIVNLIMGAAAYGGHNLAGSSCRQLAYMLVIAGWLLLKLNPWKLNKTPIIFLEPHPYNIFN